MDCCLGEWGGVRAVKNCVSLILNKLQGEARRAIAFILRGRHEHSASQTNTMRGIVAFNFSPRNLTQVTSAMKSGQGCMIWFCFGEESNSSRRVILKIELRIKQPKPNFVTVGRDSSFPSPPGAGKGMPWLSHSLTTVSIPKIILQKGK